MGVLTGIANQGGLICGIDDPLPAYLAEDLLDYPDKAAVSNGDPLTMRSGIGYSNLE